MYLVQSTGALAMEVGPQFRVECGMANRGNKVVGGLETEVNEYPWQVSHNTENTKFAHCFLNLL